MLCLVKYLFSQALVPMPAHALMPLADPRPIRARRVRPSSAQLDYLWKIALEEVSKASRATYRARLKHFSNWLGIEADLLPVLILQSDPASFRVSAQDYREALETGPMAPATANLTLAALSRIIGRLHEARLIDWTYRAKAFNVEAVRDTAGPSADATRALLAAAVTGQADPFRPARDEALIRLALSLGLRRSELVRLDLDDVREGRGGRLQVGVRGKGKAGKRPLVVPDNAAAALRRWLQVREGFASSGAPRPLFIRLTPAARARRVALRLSDEGVAHILERLRKHAGIEEKIRAHGLRHHAITSLLESGATLADTVAFARHSDPKTTMVYWDNQQQAAAKAARVVDRLY
jgi:integrase